MKSFRKKRPFCFYVLLFVILLLLLEWLPVANIRTRQKRSIDSGQAADASFASEDLLSLSHQYKKREELQSVLVIGTLVKKEEKNGRHIYYLKKCTVKTAQSEKAVNAEISQPKKEETFYEEGIVCYPDEDADGLLGMQLCLQGKLTFFSFAENEGQFDACDYYHFLGYERMLVSAKLIYRGKKYDWLSEQLQNARGFMKSFYETHMSAQDASVLCAMLLGEKSQMDEELKSLYQKNGIAHILAISGLHISFLGMGIYQLLKKCFMPPLVCQLSAMTFILLYGKLVQGQSSVIRASCMFLMYVLADLLDKSYDMLTAMSLSALLILLHNPYSISTAGFWLSFLAVFGIAVVNPLLAKGCRKHCFYKKSPKVFQRLMDSFLASVSVQLVTLPVLLWFFYEVPVYSAVLNLFVVPFVVVIIASGFSAVLFQKGILLVPAGMVLRFYEILCTLFQKLPNPILCTGRPKVWQVVCYYGLLLLWISLLDDKERQGFVSKGRIKRLFLTIRGYGMVRIAIFVLSFGFLLYPARRMDAVDLLSVGQGDCICLRTADGICAIVDGGSNTEKEVGKYRLLPYLKFNGITKVDAVFVTHAHLDHTSAIAELLALSKENGIRIGQLILSDIAKQDPKYEFLIMLAKQQEIPVHYMSQGERLTAKRMQVLCVYPGEGEQITEENNESLVLCVQMGQFRMLLTGDLSGEAEQSVLRELDRQKIRIISCLKAAHHGARTSTGEDFLDALKPSSVVISCGRKNIYSHPHDEMLLRLKSRKINCYATLWEGQIRISVQKHGYSVKGFF